LVVEGRTSELQQFADSSLTNLVAFCCTFHGLSEASRLQSFFAKTS
jgi:hypothetical protein